MVEQHKPTVHQIRDRVGRGVISLVGKVLDGSADEYDGRYVLEFPVWAATCKFVAEPVPSEQDQYRLVVTLTGHEPQYLDTIRVILERADRVHQVTQQNDGFTALINLA